MSKRIACILGIVLFLVFGISYRTNAQVEYVKTYLYENTTNGEVTVNIATTTIVPGLTRILGYTIMPCNSITQTPLVGLFDNTSSQQLGVMFSEAECSAGTSRDKVFPYPKIISNGLTLRVGAYTAVLIEYTR